MKYLVTILIILAVIGLGAFLKIRSVTMARPTVVQTVPQSGDTNVDPQIKEIRVTFNKDMRESWSWCRAEEGEFPEGIGQPPNYRSYYLSDKRTCVMPVKLKPKTKYAIWLNRGKYVNFQDKDGHSAIPYLLVFETK